MRSYQKSCIFKKRKEKKQRMKNEQKVCDSFSPASAFFSLAVSNRVPNFSLAYDFFCGRKSLHYAFFHLRLILKGLKIILGKISLILIVGCVVSWLGACGP